jgi:hypothetical protein
VLPPPQDPMLTQAGLGMDAGMPGAPMPPPDPYAQEETLASAPTPAPSDIYGALDAPQDPFSGLTPEQQLDLRMLLTDGYRAAQAARSEVDRQLPILRKYMHLSGKRQVTVNGKPAPEGTPNVLTPLIRARGRQTSTNIESALIKSRPFASAVAWTSQAQGSTRTWEDALEKHLRTTDGIAQIKRAVWDAPLVHCAVLKVHIEPTPDPALPPRVETRFIPAEDILVFPTFASNLQNSIVFEKLRKTAGELRHYASKNYYDPAAVEEIIGVRSFTGTSVQDNTGVTDNVGGVEGTSLEPVLYEEVHVRWQPDPETPPAIWRCWYCYDGEVLLRAEPADYPFDRPPYQPIRSEDRDDSFYAQAQLWSLVEYQEIIDWAFNSMLSEGNWALAPLLITDSQRLYDSYMKGQVAPGTMLYSPNGAGEENVRAIQFQQNPATLQLMETVRMQASQAMPDVPSLPPGTRQNTTAVNIWSSGMSAQLGSLISSISSDLKRYVDMLWKALGYYEYAAKPSPVWKPQDGMRPSETSYLWNRHLEIDVPDIEATQDRQNAIALMLVTTLGIPGPAADQLAQQLTQMLGPKTDKLIVHSADRDDISWEITGGETMPEQMKRIEDTQAVVQTLSMVASMNPPRAPLAIYNAMKRFYIARGFQDYSDILGEPPPEKVDEATAASVMAALQAMMGYQRPGVISDTPQ